MTRSGQGRYGRVFTPVASMFGRVDLKYSLPMYLTGPNWEFLKNAFGLLRSFLRLALSSILSRIKMNILRMMPSGGISPFSSSSLINSTLAIAMSLEKRNS
ncbi:hypothetical protein LV478_15295 [Komagataeibacter oboediens]|uniref:hypothetical protein n=1 Tax=Komagataeibacter oboediens TaxID=65958 RepID=UPI0023D9E78D|nr:hypothetical protein [Komagataeibacter oboediens]WEQ51855.1 hypothetical protein LV478_15295 [Komagataeibacter oboediens]